MIEPKPFFNLQGLDHIIVAIDFYNPIYLIIQSVLPSNVFPNVSFVW